MISIGLCTIQTASFVFLHILQCYYSVGLHVLPLGSSVLHSVTRAWNYFIDKHKHLAFFVCVVPGFNVLFSCLAFSVACSKHF